MRRFAVVRSAGIGFVILTAVACSSGERAAARDTTAAADGARQVAALDGGATRESPPPGVLDACTLLTPAAAQDALGGPVTVRPNPGGAMACDYVPAGHSATDLRRILLQVRRGSQSNFDLSRQLFTGVQTAPGIGDDAFYVDALGSTLHVLRGDKVLQLNIVLTPEDRAREHEALERAARAVIERL